MGRDDGSGGWGRGGRRGFLIHPEVVAQEDPGQGEHPADQRQGQEPGQGSHPDQHRGRLGQVHPGIGAHADIGRLQGFVMHPEVVAQHPGQGEHPVHQRHGQEPRQGSHPEQLHGRPGRRDPFAALRGAGRRGGGSHGESGQGGAAVPIHRFRPRGHVALRGGRRFGALRQGSARRRHALGEQNPYVATATGASVCRLRRGGLVAGPPLEVTLFDAFRSHASELHSARHRARAGTGEFLRHTLAGRQRGLGCEGRRHGSRQRAQVSFTCVALLVGCLAWQKAIGGRGFEPGGICQRGGRRDRGRARRHGRRGELPPLQRLATRRRGRLRAPAGRRLAAAPPRRRSQRWSSRWRRAGRLHVACGLACRSRSQGSVTGSRPATQVYTSVFHG
mmetsp:Transcript_46846/g.150531  ORF Transcript_46846/g.150531 Transcript_46846/m.150531 type:complete len:390 (+) Transcript_46846:1405-2574(+)